MPKKNVTAYIPEEIHEGLMRKVLARVNAAMIFASKGLIPEARIYANRKINRSIDFTVVKKYLVKKIL